MEEGGKKRGRERGRSTRFGCPSLSHNRAMKLCRRGLPLTMAAATAARFSWNDTLLLSKWVSGGGGLLDLPRAPQNGTSTLWASQKEGDWGLLFLACYFWNRVRPLNRCWWKEGAQTSGLDCQEQSLCTAGLEGRSTAGSWPLPRRISGTPVLWTTAP